jgi:hypothetical protein
LKWDLSKVADAASTGRDPRWLTVNVGFSSEMAQRLRGQRVRIGYWVKLGGGTTVPGLGLRQNLKDGPGEGFYYRGGIEDPAVWNHFETEGRLSPDLQSMDIHTWCAIPEAELARKSFFYMDDISLQVIEEPPVSISLPIDEFYAGESIQWTVSAASATGQVKVELLSGKGVVAEQTCSVEGAPVRGTFSTTKLKPGVYTLFAKTASPQPSAPPAQCQFILAPDPFAW